MNLKKRFKSFTDKTAKFIADSLDSAAKNVAWAAGVDISQERAADFMVKAGQTVRNKPQFISKDEARLTVSLILEETLELARASNVDIYVYAGSQDVKDGGVNTPGAIKVHEDSTFSFIATSDEQDLVEVADAFADIDFVTSGGFNRYGIQAEPIKKEVYDSNMTKFIDGHRREDGKWVKGKSYRPADIKSLIEEQQG